MPPAPPASPASPFGRRARALALLGLAMSLPFPASLTAQGEDSLALPPTPPAQRPFRHAVHLRTIPCGDCHLPEERHRASRPWSPPDCAACHHTERVVGGCTTCHERPELAGPRRISTLLDLSVWHGPRPRQLDFDHALHPRVGCLECHRRGMDRPPASCGSCHGEHHHAEAVCSRCHAPPPPEIHDRSAHLGCGGAGCHGDAGAGVPRFSRAACLVCHRERETHRPGLRCVQCHPVPLDSTHATESAAHGSPTLRP